MKNFTSAIFLAFFMVVNLSAQQEKGIYGPTNWLSSWTEFMPNKVSYGEPTEILTGTISKDTKLTKRNTYLLLGSVFVTDSTTLTIEPGTVILGDFKTSGSLTISKGCKIIAEGLETDPIIFTSNRAVKKPGDWGGLFVLGDAPINSYGSESSIEYDLRPSSYTDIGYGGDNCESDSGIMRFVRIEYAGKRTKNHGYFNALTLAGVGNKTVLENVMVSYCHGDAFKILGGDIRMNKMVSYKSSKNDYVFNQGAQCNIDNSLAVRSPYVSVSKRSRSLYVASYDQKEDADFNKKTTFVNATNMTFINVSKDLQADIKLGLVKEAIYIAKDATLHMNKSVLSGFNPAVVLDSKIKINNENLDKMQFSEMYFNNCNGNIFIEDWPNNDDLENWYGNRAFNNVYSKGTDAETFINTKDKKRPDFRLRINKIFASNDVEIDD